MSESRVRENRMPGLTGGRWRSGSHGEPERCARRETGGTEPDHLPLADPPAAYLTRVDRDHVADGQHRLGVRVVGDAELALDLLGESVSIGVVSPTSNGF